MNGARIEAEVKGTVFLREDRIASAAHTLYERAKFAGVKIAGVEFWNCAFDECVFLQCAFHHSVFSDSGFTRCLFKDCSFTNVNFSRCDIGFSVLNGATLSDCTVHASRFEKTALDASVKARGTSFDACAFYECDLSQFDISDTGLSGPAFVGSCLPDGLAGFLVGGCAVYYNRYTDTVSWAPPSFKNIKSDDLIREARRHPEAMELAEQLIRYKVKNKLIV